LMFYKPGDSEEIGRREWTTSVLEVYIDMAHAGTRFTLYYLANILRKYQNDHPMYRLFGANCWAWSRAIILDIIKPPRRIERVTMANKDPDITPDQLKIYLMTEYGAWGGLLLRCVGESWSLSCPFLGSVFIIPKFQRRRTCRIAYRSISYLADGACHLRGSQLGNLVQTRIGRLPQLDSPLTNLLCHERTNDLTWSRLYPRRIAVGSD
jgi:hypothetical protein